MNINIYLKKLFFYKLRLIFSIVSIIIISVLIITEESISRRIEENVISEGLFRGNQILKAEVNRHISNSKTNEQSDHLYLAIESIIDYKEVIDSFHILNMSTDVPNKNESRNIQFTIVLQSKGEICIDKTCKDSECALSTEEYNEIFTKQSTNTNSTLLLLSSGFLCNAVKLPKKLKFLQRSVIKPVILLNINSFSMLVNENWKSKVKYSLITVNKKISKALISQELQKIANLKGATNIVINLDQNALSKQIDVISTSIFGVQRTFIIFLMVIMVPISFLILILGQRKLILLETGLRLTFGANKSQAYKDIILYSIFQSSVISISGLFIGAMAGIVISIYWFPQATWIPERSFFLYCFGILSINCIISIIPFTYVINKDAYALLKGM